MLKTMDLFDDMYQELPWDKKALEKEAKKVGSEKFFWFGQLGTKEQMRELSERCADMLVCMLVCCRASCCLA